MEGTEIADAQSAEDAPWRRPTKYNLRLLRTRPKSSTTMTKTFDSQLDKQQISSVPGSARTFLDIETFFQLDEKDLFQLMKQEYSAELERLKTAYSLPGKRDESITSASPSQMLYGEDYDEINRTLVGIRALRWIRAKDYHAFVGSQSACERLRPESFEWICEIFAHGLKNYTDDDDFYTLITSMIINDLGKSPTLAEDFAKHTDTDVRKVNHDMILYQVLQDADTPNVDLIPCLGTLTHSQRRDLFLGIKLGAEFNFGQLAQAENVPACLSGLKEMSGRVHAFNLRFMEQLLDIAGASGHLDHTCAKKLIEPIFDSYYNVYDIAVKIINGEFGLREGYDAILMKKLVLLEKAGWHTKLDAKRTSDRALLRLLCIGGAADIDTADLYRDTFNNLPDQVHDSLVCNLNIDGSLATPAVQPTYIPAMCALAISSTKQGTTDERRKALSAVLTYLSRVLILSAERKSCLPQGVTVIEREVRTIMQDVLKSNEFKDDPYKALANLAIPGDEVAKMAEGYDWPFAKTPKS